MAVDASTSTDSEVFFHEESGTVRFWVRTGDGGWMGAMVRQELLRHRYQAGAGADGLLQAYAEHRPELEAAVLRRVATGSIEPVLLREVDLDRP